MASPYLRIVWRHVVRSTSLAFVGRLTVVVRDVGSLGHRACGGDRRLVFPCSGQAQGHVPAAVRPGGHVRGICGRVRGRRAVDDHHGLDHRGGPPCGHAPKAVRRLHRGNVFRREPKAGRSGLAPAAHGGHAPVRGRPDRCDHELAGHFVRLGPTADHRVDRGCQDHESESHLVDRFPNGGF